MSRNFEWEHHDKKLSKLKKLPGFKIDKYIRNGEVSGYMAYFIMINNKEKINIHPQCIEPAISDLLSVLKTSSVSICSQMWSALKTAYYEYFENDKIKNTESKKMSNQAAKYLKELAIRAHQLFDDSEYNISIDRRITMELSAITDHVHPTKYVLIGAKNIDTFDDYVKILINLHHEYSHMKLFEQMRNGTIKDEAIIYAYIAKLSSYNFYAANYKTMLYEIDAEWRAVMMTYDYLTMKYNKNKAQAAILQYVKNKMIANNDAFYMDNIFMDCRSFDTCKSIEDIDIMFKARRATILLMPVDMDSLRYLKLMKAEENNKNDENIDDENIDDENIDDENIDDENIDDENIDDENIDDENIDDENIDDENIDDENIDDENIDDENIDDENKP